MPALGHCLHLLEKNVIFQAGKADKGTRHKRADVKVLFESVAA